MVPVSLLGLLSVPKFPPIPRLSIVIPIGQDLAAFESTLISVLENRPLASEVIVAHDGHYDDPFDLCDEVRFVTSNSGGLIDLVAASISQTRGRFVHVLSDGIRATPGWTDDAVEKFEHYDAGVVTPVIRSQQTGKIVAAGWCDRGGCLCQAAAAGRATVAAGTATALGGAYLQASFWRRELIRSACSAFTGDNDSIETSYAVGQMVRRAGWRCVLANECTLKCDAEELPWQTSSLRLSRRLRAIHSHFYGGGWLQSVGGGLRALITNAVRPSEYLPSAGQMLGPLSAVQVAGEIHQSVVPRYECHDEVIMRMPSRAGHGLERAA
jgi:hypothetical protein